MLDTRFLCSQHCNQAGDDVTADFGSDIELPDNPEEGTTRGIITFILYKGNHYHLTVETESHEKLFVDTTDVWEDFDEVGIKILPQQIEVK